MSQDTTVNSIAKTSLNLMEERIQTLKTLMPDLFDGDGNLDETALRDLIISYNGDKTEKFVFSWSGKQASKRVAFEPSRATLKSNLKTSKNFDTTKNLLIEGDNLEVLKLLQKSYYNKVKCIYIDPPYNTGKDFIYPDNYGQDNNQYWQSSSSKDANGVWLTTNSDTSGKYHSNWLNMMQPRLLLARNLMREDGVIFVSIDDHEVHNLRKLMDEVFGEENFVGNLIWNTHGHTDNQYELKVNHEYIIVFAKQFDKFSFNDIIDPNTRENSNLRKGFAENSITKNGSANPPSIVNLPLGFPVKSKDKFNLPKTFLNDRISNEIKDVGFITREITKKYDLSYPIRLDEMILENSTLVADCKVFSGWANLNKLNQFITNKFEPIMEEDGSVLSFYLSENGVIYYHRERNSAKNILSVLNNFTTTEQNRSNLERENIIFQYPKPVDLVKYILSLNSNNNDIILDFFAGSGTAGQAVMELNAEDGGNRQFILVQIPEKTDEKSEAYKAGYKTIFDITAERIGRTGDKIINNQKLTIKNELDIGFRVLTLGGSNFPENTFDQDPDKTEVENLMALEEYLAVEQNLFQLGNDKSDELILEIALKQGFDLGYTVEKVTDFKSNTVYLVQDETQKMLICLDETIHTETVEKMKNFPEINLVCVKSSLDTTNKWNLEQIITKDRLFIF